MAYWLRSRIEIVFTIFLFVIPYFSTGQNLTQTVRGIVIDKDSKVSLPGANIILVGSNPLIGVVSDQNGAFKLENIPVGRRSLRITFLGYKELILADIVVNSAKEVILNVEMEESIMTTNEATVIGEQQKDKPLNEMSSVSARTFNLEETSKYAGSWGDPSRMVANFAGVAGGNDQRNDIVVRGNSPTGMLWKLEGMDIPSPNHFSTNGASGGAISILNNNTLENSDFMTGAFSAEYGNAISGVFDLRLRKGNNEKREYTAQIGAAGFELGVEGPFIKSKKASYLISYRYSAFALLAKLGFFDFVGAVPYYQDFTSKFTFPYSKGSFSVFAIGGRSYMTFQPAKDTTTWKDDPYLMRKRVPESTMGVAGIIHTHFLSNKTFVKTGFVACFSKMVYYEDSADYNYDYHKLFYSNFGEGSNTGSILVNSKVSQRFNVKVGASYSYLYFNFLTEHNFFVPTKFTYRAIDFKGNSSLGQCYIQSKYKLRENLSLTTGIHETYYFLNNRNSLEPRAGMKWEFTKRQSLALGYGMHSRILPAGIYFSNVTALDGSVSRENKNLDFIHSTHYILAYDNLLNASLRLKLEGYYQQVSKAPVLRDTLSYFSGLNIGADYENITGTRAMVSTGTGTNYGIEVTLEKFYSQGYYFLVTASLFESKYKGSDGIERNTTFNSNYAANVLAGKEFKVGKAKNNTFGLSMTLVTIGGRREVPILLDSSNAAGEAIFDYNRAYEQKIPDYKRLDGRISFRLNRKKVSHEISLDIRNLLNRKNVFLSYYDPHKKEIKYEFQAGFFPVLFYKLEF